MQYGFDPCINYDVFFVNMILLCNVQQRKATTRKTTEEQGLPWVAPSYASTRASTILIAL